MELQGRVAFVSGGASGIGRASTLAFARAGAAVGFTYWSSAEEAAEIVRTISGEGGRAHAMKVDMKDGAAVEQAVAEAEETLGPIDILFANAGGLVKRSRCTEMTDELWHEVMGVNLTSTFLVCRSVLRRMEPRKRGTIITMSSLAAFDGGGPGATAYAASKGAVATYTRGLAKEVGPLGIRVNGVAPGLIGTRFHDVFNTPEGRQATVDRTPLRREGHPEDVAETVVWLASDKSSFLAGETIQINGGLGMF